MDDDPYPSLLLLIELQTVSIGFWLIIALVFIVLLIFSALVSGSEVAFFSLSVEDLRQLRAQNDEKSQLILRLVEAPQKLLATLLILNTLFNMGIVTLSVFIGWVSLGRNGLGFPETLMLIGLVSFVVLFFAEIVPRTYAHHKRDHFSRLTARWVYVSFIILNPVSKFLMSITNVVGRRISKKGYSLSVDDIHQALEITTENTTTEERDILKGIVNFGTLTVKQVMRSRMDLTAVDIELDFHELMDKINKSGYSRIPVYSETLDFIKGILYIKDLLNHLDKDEDFKWQTLIRKGFFVPENKKVDVLLQDFKNKRVHMAIVVDEYGGTSGLVTLEDLIEEIIGEINDEFDDEDLLFTQLDPDTYMVEGKVSLNDFCKKLEIEPNVFDEVRGESESMGGLLLEINSKLPKSGTVILFKQFEFTIVAVDAKKIKRIKIKLLNSAENN